MNITVTKLTAGEHTALSNLMKMYCYEWSQYNLFDVDQDGVFPFERSVPSYLNRPRCLCYLVRVDGMLAGFAIIDDDFALRGDGDYAMGEFFVMHKYRRMGVGSRLATTLFDAHRGKWELGFHPRNAGSEKFWLHLIAAYTGGRFTLTRDCPSLRYHDGCLGSVIAFDNGEQTDLPCDAPAPRGECFPNS